MDPLPDPQRPDAPHRWLTDLLLASPLLGLCAPATTDTRTADWWSERTRWVAALAARIERIRLQTDGNPTLTSDLIFTSVRQSFLWHDALRAGLPTSDVEASMHDVVRHVMYEARKRDRA